MAYDEKLAERVRVALEGRRGVSEKKMFGGLCFLVRGNMACGIVGDELMVRVGPDAYEDALARKHAREMDFTGRALKGMVYVAKPGLRSTALRGWVDRGFDFAHSLPAKP
jgi:TfoX/Sxy family transcriptional regulator of competence genes